MSSERESTGGSPSSSTPGMAWISAAAADLLKGLGPVDYTLAAFFTFAVAALVYVGDRKKWLIFDAASGFFFCLPFAVAPSFFLPTWFTVRTSESHEFLSRIFFTHIMALCLFIMMTLKSRDHTVPVSILNSRAVMMLATCAYLFGNFMSRFGLYPPHFLHKNAYLLNVYLAFILYPIGIIYFLRRSTYFANYSQRSTWTNLHMRIGFFGKLILAMFLFAAPEFSWRTWFNIFDVNTEPDAVTRNMLANLAIIVVGETFLALEATGYMYNQDKQSFFITRAVQYASGLVTFTFYSLSVVWNPAKLLFACAAVGPLLANDILGYLAVTRESSEGKKTPTRVQPMRATRSSTKKDKAT